MYKHRGWSSVFKESLEFEQKVMAILFKHSEAWGFSRFQRPYRITIQAVQRKTLYRFNSTTGKDLEFLKTQNHLFNLCME